MPADPSPVADAEVLAPCPMCGAAARFVWLNSSDHGRVKCTRPSCGTEGGRFAHKTNAVTAWNTRLRFTDPQVKMMREAVEMAHELIQKAKGADGPNGGFVTDHLDAAENWLYKVDAALAPVSDEGVGS